MAVPEAAAVEVRPLLLRGIASLPREFRAEEPQQGRVRLRTISAVVDPSKRINLADEQPSVKLTEISKMKGQSLVCAPNANLVAVNLRYIIYAMKEGQVRVINQNGREMFKLMNSSEATITDLTLNGDGRRNTPIIILVLNSDFHLTILQLDAQSGDSIEDRVKRSELIFLPSGPAHRVLRHPLDPKSFVTLHASSFVVWSVDAIEQATSPTKKCWRRDAKYEYTVHFVDAFFQNVAGHQVVLPSGCGELLSGVFSVDSACFVALTTESVLVYQLTQQATKGKGAAQAFKLLQHCSLGRLTQGSHRFNAVHIVGTCQPEHRRNQTNSEAEVVVFASREACTLFAFELYPKSPAPIGRLAQVIRFGDVDGTLPQFGIERIATECCWQDSISIALHGQRFICVLPLALHWFGIESGLPFPYIQRIVTDGPTHQLSAMSGRPYQTEGLKLFLYRAHNFIREKDQQKGCYVVVNEVVPQVVARGAPVAPQSEAQSESEEAPEATVDNATGSPLAAAEFVDPFADAPMEAEFPAPGNVDSIAEYPGEVDGSGGGAAEVVAPSLGPPASEQQGPPFPDGDASFDAYEDATAQPSLEEASFGVEEPTQDNVAAPAPLATALAASPAMECVEALEDADAQATGVAADVASVNVLAGSGEEQGRDAVDWGFVKQIAASFVKGLDKRRKQTVDSIVEDVVEAVRAQQGVPTRGAASSSHAASFSSADLALLDEALAKIHEAREAQTSSDKRLSTAVRKATDAWAEASAATVSSTVQKELAKVSDNVAVSLANQLSQSRKFCEALARGVQKTSGSVTRQTLEALRPDRKVQESVIVAMGEILHESLAPVFRRELRSHFEQELAPLIAKRVSEMMSTFRDKMGECLKDIAVEHEQAAQRLVDDLHPVVAEELRKVERVLADGAAGGEPSAASGTSPLAAKQITEAELDELARAVQEEVVQPLQSRIKDLTTQLQALRDEAKELERRWSQANAALANAGVTSAGPDGMPPTPCLSGLGSLGVQQSPAEIEEQQALALESQFRAGRADDAFAKACSLQQKAEHVDFLDRLCRQVQEPVYDWLGEGSSTCPISTKVKCQIMVGLAQQLSSPKFAADREVLTYKIDWIQDLWVTADLDEPSGLDGAASCGQLFAALDAVPMDTPGISKYLNSLKSQVRVQARLLEKKT